MKTRSQSGFTLLEILIVIVIITLLATTVAPRIAGVTRVGVQSSVRRYSGLIRYAYSNAVLTGRVHRVVLDLDNQSWRVEMADPGMLPTDEQAEKNREEIGKDEKEAPTPAFKKVGKNIIDKIPSGVQIVQVESWRIGRGVAATKGEVYIYAYPAGFIDESTVVLAQIGKEAVQNYRITTKSLTGRVKVEIVNEGQKQ
jgi:prepilin-type N-terminal cleavage/methylation domain-containing protein